MVTKDFPIFDCDSHVVEPPEIWEEYLPSAIRSWVKTQFHFHTDTGRRGSATTSAAASFCTPDTSSGSSPSYLTSTPFRKIL